MGKLYECEDIMKDVKHNLEKMFEVDPLVYSNLYLLSLEYHEKRQNWDEFYNNAIQYLAYVKENVTNILI
jgi:26S proteasome regulatory subunit N9